MNLTITYHENFLLIYLKLWTYNILNENEKKSVFSYVSFNFLFSENTIYERKHHLKMNKNELDKQLKKESCDVEILS